MSKYRIGITEAGDAGLDLSWVNQLDYMDGAVLITKCCNNPEFQRLVLEHKDKLIVHITCTGFGGYGIEPNVPSVSKTLDAAIALREAGFPADKIVIRVDPIIPTRKGISTAFRVMMSFMEKGFSRYRVSIIDMYPHVRERFLKAGLPLPYGSNGFSPSKTQVDAVNHQLKTLLEYWNCYSGKQIRIESCAEPGLTTAIQCGCISQYDLKLLGLHDEADAVGYQRRNCLCYSGKMELLKQKRQCPNGCLYCYWR